MDRATLLEHLMQAIRHVDDGERIVAEQEALVAKLAREGHATDGARELLRLFRTSQRLHEEHRARIIELLAEARDKAP